MSEIYNSQELVPSLFYYRLPVQGMGDWANYHCYDTFTSGMVGFRNWGRSGVSFDSVNVSELD